MTVLYQPAVPIWVRANPRSLSAAQIAAIRETRHLTDLDVGPLAYRCLIRAGHRYAGELAYIPEADVSGYIGMGPVSYDRLQRALSEVGIEIGSKVRVRVWAPSLELMGLNV